MKGGATFNDDDEQNFPDLQEHIKKNITILKKINIEKMIKIENEKIEFKIGKKSSNLKTLKNIYLSRFFHISSFI